MLNKEEFLSLKHKSIPISARFDTAFLYNDIQYTIGKMIYNPVIDRLVSSIRWRKDGVERAVYGIPITTGVNIVQQINSGLPSLVANNINSRGTDVNRIEDLKLFIIEDFDKYFVSGE